ncbi:MAG TPA: hypothetical protein VG994_19645 [Steroidobacteraceae bacterium]|jgi:hypothetical protein|nr:hypothetical protein [Steroidobacteraceae bacterium]
MKPRLLFASQLASWLLCVAVLPAGAQTPVQIPGTFVTLAAPAGFRIARSFPGLEDPKTGSTIKVAEYPPENFAEVAAVFASPKTASTRYASEGVRFTRIESVAVDGGQAPLAVGQQVRNGRELAKYVTVLGGGRAKTALVTFDIAAAQNLSPADIASIVRSIKVANVPTADEKLARLAFEFKVSPPFRFADSSDPNTATLTTYDGVDATGLKPLAIISRAGTTALPRESAQTAEQALRGMAANAQIKERATVPFAGGQGAFLSAVVDNRTVLLFLRVLPGGTYLQLLAVGETMAMMQVSQTVKDIAATVELR